MSEEKLVWEGTPSQVTNLGVFLFWGLMALSLVLIPVSLGVIVWKYLVVKNQKYELSTQRLKLHSGVLSKRTDALELYRVRDTRFDQPFFLRLFGLGNVVLVTSDATSPSVLINAVPDASALCDTVRGLVEARRDLKRVRSIEAD